VCIHSFFVFSWFDLQVVQTWTPEIQFCKTFLGCFFVLFFLPLGKCFLKWISGVQILISKETKELHLHPTCCCSKGEHPLSSTTLQGLLGKDMSALLLKLTSKYVHLPLAWASSISERYWTRTSKWKQWRQSRIERNQRFCCYCLHYRWWQLKMFVQHFSKVLLAQALGWMSLPHAKVPPCVPGCSAAPRSLLHVFSVEQEVHGSSWTWGIPWNCPQDNRL
jgi:hypothetical protein